MKNDHLAKFENVDHNRSFNLSQISRIGSDITRPEQSANQVETDYQFKQALPEKKYPNNQPPKGYQRSERSKEREAILKQTQDLIKKSQDRLKWHQSENKNINAFYSFDKLKQERITPDFQMQDK